MRRLAYLSLTFAVVFVAAARPATANLVYSLEQGGGDVVALLHVSAVPFDHEGVVSLTFLNGAGMELGLTDGVYQNTLNFTSNGPVVDDGFSGLESSNAGTAFVVDRNPPPPFVNLALLFGGSPSGGLFNTDAITTFSDRIRAVSGDWKLTASSAQVPEPDSMVAWMGLIVALLAAHSLRPTRHVWVPHFGK